MGKKSTGSWAWRPHTDDPHGDVLRILYSNICENAQRLHIPNTTYLLARMGQRKYRLRTTYYRADHHFKLIMPMTKAKCINEAKPW